MGNYNKVVLMGNLTRDPELRYLQSGNAICKFGLAINRRFKDSQSGEWREEPTFVDITMFGKRGEAFSKFHKKGGQAFIEGSLRLDSWEDKESGQKRSKLYVVGDNWEFCGGRESGGGGGGGGYGGGGQQGAGGYGGGAGGGYGAPQGGGNQGGGEPDFLEVEDTPF